MASCSDSKTQTLLGLTLSCLRPRGTLRSYHAWNPNILPQKTGEHRRTHQTLRPLSVGHQGISNMWLWAVHGHSWALVPASSSDSSSNCLLGRLGSMTVSVRAKRLKTTLLACTDMYWLYTRRHLNALATRSTNAAFHCVSFSVLQADRTAWRFSQPFLFF